MTIIFRNILQGRHSYALKFKSVVQESHKTLSNKEHKLGLGFHCPRFPVDSINFLKISPSVNIGAFPVTVISSMTPPSPTPTAGPVVRQQQLHHPHESQKYRSLREAT